MDVLYSFTSDIFQLQSRFPHASSRPRSNLCLGLRSRRAQFTALAAPAALPARRPAARLQEPLQDARITVAGLVILRQRPGTAKG